VRREIGPDSRVASKGKRATAPQRASHAGPTSLLPADRAGCFQRPRPGPYRPLGSAFWRARCPSGALGGCGGCIRLHTLPEGLRAWALGTHHKRFDETFRQTLGRPDPGGGRVLRYGRRDQRLRCPTLAQQGYCRTSAVFCELPWPSVPARPGPGGAKRWPLGRDLLETRARWAPAPAWPRSWQETMGDGATHPLKGSSRFKGPDRPGDFPLPRPRVASRCRAFRALSD